MRNQPNSRNPNFFFIKRLAEQIISGQTPQISAEALLREETKRHRNRLGPDGARALAHLVAVYFRWLRWTKETPSEDRAEAAAALDARFSADPASFSEAEFRKATPEWVAAEVDAPASWWRALQRRPPLWLRARPGTGGRLAAELEGATRPFAQLEDCLRFDSLRDLFRLDAFTSGACEVQDIASHLAAIVCSPKPGECWWDACAGEGGKTMHLCDLMHNQGLVWASDKAKWRLDRLRRRAARLKRFNFRTALWSGGQQLPTKTRFDGVLLDAPCSGLGTWHRDPWARWTTKPSDVAELASLQLDLLRAAATGVKPGGRLVYAVCTVTRSETVAVADGFEAGASDFEPVALGLPNLPALGLRSDRHRLQLWQGDAQGNGMFFAAWRRRG